MIKIDGWNRKPYMAVDSVSGTCAHCERVEGDGLHAVSFANIQVILCKNCLLKLKRTLDGK